MKKFILPGTLAAVILDQASKWFMLSYFPEYVTFNSGIAFGLRVPEIVLFIGIPLLLSGFLYWVSTQNKTAFHFLILGGGFSNYFDRLLRGSVVDFIDFGFWPSFNLADSFLTVGVIGLLLCAMKRESLRDSR